MQGWLKSSLWPVPEGMFCCIAGLISDELKNKELKRQEIRIFKVFGYTSIFFCHVFKGTKFRDFLIAYLEDKISQNEVYS